VFATKSWARRAGAAQPAQTSYLDVNASWPLNCWSGTGNRNGYPLSYLQLLAQFVGEG